MAAQLNLDEDDGVIGRGVSTGPTPHFSGEALRESVATLEAEVCGTLPRETWLEEERDRAIYALTVLAGMSALPPIGPANNYGAWTDQQLRNWERHLQKAKRKAATDV